MLSILFNYLPEFAAGALVTLQLATIVWALGLVLGGMLGVWRASLSGVARHASSFIVTMISAVPILVVLLWFHYPLQARFGVVITPFATAACVLSAHNGLLVSDLIRGAIDDFPRSLASAAAVNGVPKQVFRRQILFPIVLRTILPGYLVSQVGALHLTLFASLISVAELFRVAQRVNAIEYKAVEVFSLLALFYFVLSFPLLLLARWIRNRLTLPGLDR